MHEMSLVRALFDQVDRVRSEHPSAALTVVRVEVGPLAGVEPTLLASAFEQLAPQRYDDAVEFVVDEVPLRAQCATCHHAFDMRDFVFRCEQCDSTDVRITGGDRLELVSISLRPHQTSREFV